ncbi:MAG TPA: hypothetical protein VHP12_07530, partial [Chitinophagaceae bacterium]|nr:hypothetical protein [Chitinophagaceae bacterium]
MNDMNFKNIDALVKEAAEKIARPDFDNQAWDKMNQLLDNEFNKKKRRFIIWWWLLPVTLIVIATAYYFISKNNELTREQSIIKNKETGILSAPKNEKEKPGIIVSQQNNQLNKNQLSVLQQNDPNTQKNNKEIIGSSNKIVLDQSIISGKNNITKNQNSFNKPPVAENEATTPLPKKFDSLNNSQNTNSSENKNVIQKTETKQPDSLINNNLIKNISKKKTEKKT